MRTVSRQHVISGSHVAITGAARGMGALYARAAHAGGARAIALIDIDSAELDRLADTLRSPECAITCYPIDLTQLAAVQQTARAIELEHGTVDVLINNAGIVAGTVFWEHDQDRDITRTIQLNTLAPMWLTRELLPSMIADSDRPRRILNIASAAGTIAVPNMSVYAASKWALLGWSESLRLELSRSGHRHLGVTAFCPSYVSTGMFAGARGPLLTPIMTPGRAARTAWRGMIRATPVVMRPWTVKLAATLRAALPTRAWDALAGSVFRVNSSMDQFTGRPAGDV